MPVWPSGFMLLPESNGRNDDREFFIYSLRELREMAQAQNSFPFAESVEIDLVG